MKRALLFTSITVLMLLSCCFGASGQSRYGIMGGFSFSHATEVGNRGSVTKYNAGVTYQLKLPLGFSVQPSLLYHVKGARVKGDGGTALDITTGYLELPVSFQWGPDLLLFRPFLDVSPYIGVGLNNSLYCRAQGSKVADETNIWGGAGIARMEYGVGVGLGVEIWRFQIIGRYNWNLGKIYCGSDATTPANTIMKTTFGDGGNFSGLTLSVALLF